MLAEATAAETRTCIATADNICRLDEWIERTAASWRIPEEVMFRSRVCVAEVAANLLEHGRVRPDGDEMTVTLRPDGTALEIEVTDAGRAFDPTAPAAETVPTGGRGIRLLRAYAAAISYRRDTGRNILRMQVVPAQPRPELKVNS